MCSCPSDCVIKAFYVYVYVYVYAHLLAVNIIDQLGII